MHIQDRIKINIIDGHMTSQDTAQVSLDAANGSWRVFFFNYMYLYYVYVSVLNALISRHLSFMLSEKYRNIVKYWLHFTLRGVHKTNMTP